MPLGLLVYKDSAFGALAKDGGLGGCNVWLSCEGLSLKLFHHA
jgi:hypothetical protein